MSVIQTGSLVIVAIIALTLTYFGYESSQAMLRFGGLAAGGAVGGWAGFVLVPRTIGASLSGGELIGIAGGALVIGAVIGQAIIPNLSRFGVMFLGFTFSTVAALVLLSGGTVIEIITQTVPQVLDQQNPELLFTQLEEITFVGDIEPIVGVGVALLIGFTGGGLVRKKLELVMALLVTIIGAMLLASVFPLLIGSGEIEEEAIVTSFSMRWLGFFVITGAIFEIVRYYDELGLETILN